LAVRKKVISRVVQSYPLVVVSVVDDASHVAALRRELATLHSEELFIGVLTAGPEDSLLPLLIAQLSPNLRELIFTTGPAEDAVAGADLAVTALEELGVGQDFVFTVPTLEFAVRYAVDALGDGSSHGWEGTAVLIPGSAETIEKVLLLFAH
jgi:hypothetical protein